MLQDVRYAIRRAASTPGLTALSVITVGLGGGLLGVLVGLVDGVYGRETPTGQATYLLEHVRPAGNTSAYFSYPEYRLLAESGPPFDHVAAFRYERVSARIGDATPEQVIGALVSWNYHSLLGAALHAGRVWTASEEQQGRAVAVVSEELWRTRLGSPRSFADVSIVLNGRPFDVIGVAAAGFSGTLAGFQPEVWVPITLQPALAPLPTVVSARAGTRSALAVRGYTWLFLLVRLGPSGTLAQAEAALSGILDGGNTAARRFRLVSLREAAILPQHRDIFGRFMLLVTIIATVVMLMASVNLSNLVAQRLLRRTQDLAIRLALGSGLRRLVRLMLAEALVIGVAGAAVALVIVWWAGAAVPRLAPPLPTPVSVPLKLGGVVVAATVMLAALTALGASVVPALWCRRLDLRAALEGGTVLRRRSRVSARALTIAQLGVATLLLVWTGLLLRSLSAAERTALGFDENVVVASVNLDHAGGDEQRGRVLMQRMVEELSTIPGVERVALARSLPLAMGSTFSVVGYDPRPRESRQVGYNVVSAGYFETLGIPLLRGRLFTEADTTGNRPVIIVNADLAEDLRAETGRDPLGQTIGAREVIGVVANSKYYALEEAPQPMEFLPLGQQYEPRISLLMRTAIEPARVIPVAGERLRAIDADVPFFGLKTMRDHLALALWKHRFAAWVAMMFGALALILAVIGLYTIIAFNALDRGPELSLRLALGATRRDVFVLVLKDGCAMALLGMGIGVLLAYASGGILASRLPELAAPDGWTLLATAVILGATALAATSPSALRACRAAPAAALRT